MSSESFEQVLATALAGGSINVAWKKFVHTRFFVPIKHSPDLDPKKITVLMAPSSAAGGNAVLISEVRERVSGGDAVLWLNGAEVIAMLAPGAAILVALGARAFPIPSDRVEWLREGLRVAQARAAAKLAPAASSGAPGIATVFASTEMPAPDRPAPARATGPAPDLAALRPRKVGMADLGLEFAIPGAWRDERTAKVLHVHDRESGMRVEASGLHRPNLSLDQWLDMRVALVGQEMRFLTQDGPAYPITGDRWGQGVSGKAVEFTGVFPGETVRGRYLVACIHIDGSVVALAVRAGAAVFEQQRALVQWMLGSITLISRAEIEARRVAAAAAAAAAAPSGAGEFAETHTETPALFGFSLQGRIGRLRALAYSVPTVMPAAALAIGAALIMPKAMLLGAIMAITGVVLMLWFSVRLMVMRLHDLNRSGKWVLLFIALSGLGGATNSPMLVAAASVGFWLFVTVIYYFVPGTRGENDYGPPPGPNSRLVIAGAAVFVLFHLLAIYGNIRMASMLRPGGALSAAQDDKLLAFTGPRQRFVIDLPGSPTPVPTAPWMNGQNGVVVKQFHLETNARLYLIQTLDFGTAQRDGYALMNKAEQSLAGTDGRLEDSKAFLFNNGVNGREVRIRRDANSVRRARLVYNGGMLMMVMIAGPDDAAFNAHADQVFRSFQLK